MAVKLKKSTKGNSPLVTKLSGAFKASLEEIIEEKRIKLDARELIPAKPKGGIVGMTVGKRVIEYMKLGFSGKVNRSFTRGKSLPRLVFGKETVVKKLLFLGTELEIDKDMKDEIEGGDVLPKDLTNYPVKLILEDENDLLINGDDKLGLEGLANLTGRRDHIVVAGAKGTTTWKDKTGEEIVRDIVKAISEFEKDGKFQARTLACSSNLHYELESKYIKETTVTVLEDLKKRGYSVKKNYSLKDDLGQDTFAILDNTSENYFFVEVLPPGLTDDYKEGRSSINVFEEKLSEVIAPHPEAIMFLGGVV